MKRLAAVLFVAATAQVASADPTPLDRAVVRFVAAETGGVVSPRFVFERELALQARFEALADRDHTATGAEPYKDRHVRAALERHIAETLLEGLRIIPPPSEREVEGRIEEVRLALLQRVGGLPAVNEAMAAEGLEPSELRRILRRQARASLYLDRMVAPMLEPSDAELRKVHRSERTPFSGRPYEEIAPALRRWYVGAQLTEALERFYDGARSRLKVTVLQ